MATSAAYIDLTEAAAPATPGAGKVRVYAKADGLPYSKDDAGAESALVGGGSGTAELLGRTFYKPATQQNPNTTSATVVDVDATNLAVTFTAPTSGAVIVRCEAACYNTVDGWGEFGVRESTTVRAVGRVRGDVAGAGASVRSFLITGLTGGNSYTFKFGFSAGTTGGTMNLYIHTDDPTVASASVGPASIEVWAA